MHCACYIPFVHSVTLRVYAAMKTRTAPNPTATTNTNTPKNNHVYSPPLPAGARLPAADVDTVGLTDPLALGEVLAAADDVSDELGVLLLLNVGVLVAVVDAVLVAVAEAVLVAVMEGVLVAVVEGVLVAVMEGVLVAVVEGVLVAVVEGVLDGVMEGVLVAVVEGVLVAVVEGVLVAVVEGVLVAVVEGVLVAVVDGVLDGVPVAVMDGEGDGVGVGETARQLKRFSPKMVSAPLLQDWNTLMSPSTTKRRVTGSTCAMSSGSAKFSLPNSVPPPSTRPK